MQQRVLLTLPGVEALTVVRMMLIPRRLVAVEVLGADVSSLDSG